MGSRTEHRKHEKRRPCQVHSTTLYPEAVSVLHVCQDARDGGGRRQRRPSANRIAIVTIVTTVGEKRRNTPVVSNLAAGPVREQPHRVLSRQALVTRDGLRARRGAPSRPPREVLKPLLALGRSHGGRRTCNGTAVAWWTARLREAHAAHGRSGDEDASVVGFRVARRDKEPDGVRLVNQRRAE